MNILLSFLLSFSLLGSSPGSKNNSCSGLKQNLGNRYQAMEIIQNTEFEFEQSFRTLQVMGVREATFYSCGSGNGYMLVETNRRTELYEDVPRELWEHFKTSRNIDYFYWRVFHNNTRYRY